MRHSVEHRLKLSKAAALRRGIPRSKETREKISKNHADVSGRNHPMFGKHQSDDAKHKISIAQKGKSLTKATREKMRATHKARNVSGENHPMFGRLLSDTTKKKISDAKRGTHHSIEARCNMRLAFLKRVQKLPGRATPNYNPLACKLIDEYGKLHGYNFQHAENGGEYHIKELGYWVDGYDKDKNAVIEVYEPHHRKMTNRDNQRQEEIMNLLKCSFIILHTE